MINVRTSEIMIGAQTQLFGKLDRLANEFEEFHEANPHIYITFQRFAFDAINIGRKHFGAGAIWERMRWYSVIESRGDPWKLNNNHRAFYARLFARDHPIHADFFRTRTSVADSA